MSARLVLHLVSLFCSCVCRQIFIRHRGYQAEAAPPVLCTLWPFLLNCHLSFWLCHCEARLSSSCGGTHICKETVRSLFFIDFHPWKDSRFCSTFVPWPIAKAWYKCFLFKISKLLQPIISTSGIKSHLMELGCHSSFNVVFICLISAVGMLNHVNPFSPKTDSKHFIFYFTFRFLMKPNMLWFSLQCTVFIFLFCFIFFPPEMTIQCWQIKWEGLTAGSFSEDVLLLCYLFIEDAAESSPVTACKFISVILAQASDHDDDIKASALQPFFFFFQDVDTVFWGFNDEISVTFFWSKYHWDKVQKLPFSIEFVYCSVEADVVPSMVL